METVSENSKGKRGRPRKYEGDGWTLDEYSRYECQPTRGLLEAPMRGWRQQQNIILAERAKDRLDAFCGEDAPEHFGGDNEPGGILELLTPRARLLYNEDGPFVPQRVYTEFGRCLEVDEALFWRVVDWYAEHVWLTRTPAAVAAQYMRELRLGQRSYLPGE